MRRILRASGLMGTASVATIAAGMARAKLLALLVGAQGIGLFGLYQSFQGLAAALAGLGLPASGVREVALANAGGNDNRLNALKSALMWLPLLTGGLAILGSWLARRPLAEFFFDDPRQAPAVLVLGIGVAALTLSLSQTAWINGLRRIGALAGLRVAGAVAGAALSVALVWRFGLSGIAWAVAGTSLVALVLTTWAWRARGSRGETPGTPERLAAAGSLIRLGAPLMLAGLLAPATHLAVRSLVLRKLGGPSLGHWQAAWSISMLYVGFVLSAMAVDYLPRLSEGSARPSRMVRLVNEQARAALLLACPVVLAMLALAPLAVRILYSRDFDPAASVLAWQLIGDLFKVPAWALVMVFAAIGRGGGHLMAEALWNVPYLALVWIGVERWGLPFCGIAFLAAYVFYFGALWLAMRRAIGFTWAPGTLGLLLSALAAAAAVRWLADQGRAGMVGQAAIVLAFAGFSYYRIRQELAADDET